MPLAHRTDINQFLNRRQDSWRRLEFLLQRVESGGLKALTPFEIREFGTLYRRASSDLVTARSKTANAEVLQYLNDLVARAYAQVYRARRYRFQDIFTFFAVDFPRLARHQWKYIALATLLFFIGAGFGWEMHQRDPAAAFYLLPHGMAKALGPMRGQWQGRTGHEFNAIEMPIMSSGIMTHNIGIGLTAFAGGIFFAVGPLYAMIENGLVLGVLGAAMSRPDTAFTFWSLILPHGILELTAIFIMGGAGFMMGGALLSPGARSRRDALIERGRPALLLALGGAAMLVIAGTIEGCLTPWDFIPRSWKLVFAGLTLVAEIVYFTRAGRGPQPGLLPRLLPYEEMPS